MQRIQSLSALPPLAFQFGDDFVWNRSEWQQGAEVSVFFGDAAKVRFRVV
jgi:hypothetical protein